MIFSRAAILASSLTSAAAAASSITTLSSEDTTSSATTRALAKSKKSSDDSQDKKENKLHSDSAGGGMQRFLSQARATFMNVEDVQSLSPEEFIFLEETMREMYEAVYGVSVKNLIVTSAETSDIEPAIASTNNSNKNKKKFNGGLRGSSTSKNRNNGGGGNRDLFWNSFGNGYRWFDFSAFFEATCTLCSPDDEADDDFYFGGGDRKLSSSSSSSDSDDDIDFEELRLEKLNTKLCEALRAGPFESFWNVQGCQIIIG